MNRGSESLHSLPKITQPDVVVRIQTYVHVPKSYIIFPFPIFPLLAPLVNPSAAMFYPFVPKSPRILQIFRSSLLLACGKSPFLSLFPAASVRLVGFWVCSNFFLSPVPWMILNLSCDGWLYHRGQVTSFLNKNSTCKRLSFICVRHVLAHFHLTAACRSSTGLAVLTTMSLHLNLALAGLPGLSHGIGSLLWWVHG